jgi:hypothetical protein
VMHFFPAMNERAAWDMPLIRLHAYVAWAEENCPMWPVERVTPGYIEQEANRGR